MTPPNTDPAFPTENYTWKDDKGAWHTCPHSGMDLRDWFAGAALPALIKSASFYEQKSYEHQVEQENVGWSELWECNDAVSLAENAEKCAAAAYSVANAMIEARKGSRINVSYYKTRHDEWERIANALGDNDPELSSFGYYAGLIESHAEEIKKIVHRRPQ